MACDLTEKLPPEVLSHIFSYLDPQGKLAAGSVCKHWLRISNDCPDLLDNVCVHLKGCEEIRNLEAFSKMVRKFSCFWFDNIIIDLNIVQFLQKFASQFHSLSFGNCEVTIDLHDPSHKISNLVNLLELKIFFSHVGELFTYLPKLESLHIAITNKFLQRDFLHLFSIAPISLIHLKVDSLCPTSRVRLLNSTYSALKGFIEKQRSTLRSLVITGMPILDENIANILKIEGLKLKHLKLPRYFAREETLIALTTCQQGIVELDLENVHLDDYSVVMICNAFPQLEVLNASQCMLINKSVSNIFKLKCLTKLDLTGCRGITNESFLNALETLACKRLKVLNLEYVTIDSSILTSLLSLLPNLRKITLDVGYDLDSRYDRLF